MTRFIVIGNPSNRRVTGFVDALRGAGQPAPDVVSHRELLAEPTRLLELSTEPAWVRIDATGEDSEVERLLIDRGFDAAAGDRCTTIDPAQLRQRGGVRFGEILAPRQHHFGFLRYLDELQACFEQRPTWRILQPTSSIAELFDKRATSRRYAELGIPVPDRLGDVNTPDGLREQMNSRGWPAVFVKIACGSSGSCVAVYQRRADRELLITTVDDRVDGRFNSLAVREIGEREPIDALLSFLIGEGSQIERAYPKARIGGRMFDLRVLVIAGEPMFAVARASRHPITNLHLGGVRADLDRVRAHVGTDAWSRALASARAVFAAHQCLHVGVDVLFESDMFSHRVIEANAFGDLLPGLEFGGRSAYAWEIAGAVGERLPRDALD